tara:strand:- start:78 stop:833 length:756 start_codon:yes stop_codon:yes gene_type:complete
MRSTHHSFNIDVAEICGVAAAVIYTNIQFWVDKNEANGKHFYEGRFWTYNSIQAFSELLPYFTEKQIRGGLNKLIDAGLIVKGNFNKIGYDRTIWYSVIEETQHMPSEANEGDIDLSNPDNLVGSDGTQHLPYRSNRCDQKGKPIPVINTDEKINNKKKNITKRKKQIPEDWSPNEKAVEIAKAENFTPEETEFLFNQFRNYCMANAKLYADFDRAFYNWLRSGITKSTINSRRRNQTSSNRELTQNQIAG